MSAHKRALFIPDAAALRRLDEVAAELRRGQSQHGMMDDAAARRKIELDQIKQKVAQQRERSHPAAQRVDEPQGRRAAPADPGEVHGWTYLVQELEAERGKTRELEAKLGQAAAWAMGMISKQHDLVAENAMLKAQLAGANIVIVEDAPDYAEMVLPDHENCRCDVSDAVLVGIGADLLKNWKGYDEP